MQLFLAFDSEYQQQHMQTPIQAWCLLDEHGELITSGELSMLSDIVQATKAYHFNTQVFLTKPDVAVTSIPRPAGSSSKIRQALPYLLEEQLADDIEDLHFSLLSLGKSADPQTLVIAVIARSILQQCIDELAAVGLTPQMITPLWLMLPQADASTWLGLISSHYLWLRTGSFTGFALERDQTTTLLNTLFVKQVPKQIEWISADGMDPEWLAECEKREIQTSVKHLSPPENWLSYVAKYALTEGTIHFSGLNLLQGEYSQKQQSVSDRRWWQWAKKLTAAIVIVWFSGICAQYFYLQHENQQLQNKIADVYREVFPNAKNISSPRLTFERELANSATNKKSNDFLSLLLLIGEATSATQQLQIASISYDGKQIFLNLSADNFSRLQQLDKQLQEKGLTVEQENAASSGGVVQARWRIG